MEFKYETTGVCAREITVQVDENNRTVQQVDFVGGCNGNLQGISALVKGKRIEEIITLLKGIDCNLKGTSCPDQLARALEDINEEL